MLPGTRIEIVSKIGERERYTGLPDGLRAYVQTEFRSDPSAVRAWIASTQVGTSAGVLRAAARAAAQAVSNAVRAFAGTAANPEGV